MAFSELKSSCSRTFLVFSELVPELVSFFSEVSVVVSVFRLLFWPPFWPPLSLSVTLSVTFFFSSLFCDRLGGGAKQSVRVCLGWIIPVLVEIYVWSEPLVVLIPFYGLGDAAVKVVLRCKSQFVTCGRDVASPVALFHDVVLVVVEGWDLSRCPAHIFAYEGDHAQQPYRCFYPYEPRVA